MFTKGKTRKSSTVILILMLVFLTACNSSKTATSGGGNNPIKIGAILSFSGSFAPISESIKQGMELYFEQNGNKIGNHPISIKYEDDEANPQVALRKYHQLVESDKVDLLVGPISTAVVYALRDAIEKDKIVLINNNAAANDISWSKKSDYIYRVSISNWQNGVPSADYISKNVGKKAYVFATDYPAGHETIDAFKEAFTKSGGQIVKESYPKLGTNDYASYMTDILDTKPDVVFANLSGTDAIRFVQQYDQFRLKGKIPLTGSQEFLDPLVTDPAGKAAEGIIGATTYNYALDNPVNKKFVDDFKKKYNKVPNYFNVHGFDSAQVITKAIEKSGSTKSADLIKVLKDISFSSPRGELTMDPNTHNLALDTYLAKNVWNEKDGKIVQEIIGTAIKGLKIPDTPPAKK